MEKPLKLSFRLTTVQILFRIQDGISGIQIMTVAVFGYRVALHKVIVAIVIPFLVYRIPVARETLRVLSVYYVYTTLIYKIFFLNSFFC
jgi:hypothetical protein